MSETNNKTKIATATAAPGATPQPESTAAREPTKEPEKSEEQVEMDEGFESQANLVFHIQSLANGNDLSKNKIAQAMKKLAGISDVPNKDPNVKKIDQFNGTAIPSDKTLSEGGSIIASRISDLTSNGAPIDRVRKFMEQSRSIRTKTSPISDAEIITFLEKLSPLQITQLMPYVAIYKATLESGLSKETCGYQLMLHRGNFDRIGMGDKVSEFFNGQRETIGGYGLKSLHLEQKTSVKSNFSFNKYTVDLEVIFDSPQDFILTKYQMKSVDGKGSPKEFTAAEVLIGREKDSISSGANPTTYMSMLEMGYSVEDSEIPRIFHDIDMPMEKISQIIQNLNFKLFLVIVNWEPTIEENGKVTLKISYIGGSEAIQAQETGNILCSNQERLDRARDGKVYDKASDSAKKESVADGMTRRLYRQQTRLMRRLFRTKKIWIATIKDKMSTTRRLIAQAMLDKTDQTYTQASTDTLSGVVRFEGVFDSADQIESAEDKLEKMTDSSSETAAQQALKEAAGLTAAKTDYRGGEIPTPFIYFSDIISAAIRQFYINMKMDYYRDVNININLEFGQVRLLNPQAPMSATQANILDVNIADIPISYKLFNTWFTQNIIDKDREFYLFKEFSEDVSNNLVAYSLNKYANDNYWQEGLQLRKLRNIIPTSYKIRSYTSIDFRDDATTGKKTMDVFIYFFSDEEEKEYLKRIATGDRDKDRERGIIWFSYGQDRGITYKIEFKKETDQMIRSSLIVKAEQSSADGEEFNSEQRTSQMREIFSVDATLFAQSWIMPGQIVCFQPTLIGMGDMNNEQSKMFQLLGMGGYYAIITNNIDYSDGKFSSKIHGRYIGPPTERASFMAPVSKTKKIGSNGETKATPLAPPPKGMPVQGVLK